MVGRPRTNEQHIKKVMSDNDIRYIGRAGVDKDHGAFIFGMCNKCKNKVLIRLSNINAGKCDCAFCKSKGKIVQFERPV